MKTKKIYALGATSILLLLLSACSSGTSDSQEIIDSTSTEATLSVKQTEYPLDMEVQDAEGNSYIQTFEKAPERVVTNNLSSIEILLELGLKDKIVGTTQPDNEVTGKHASDVEDIPIIGDKMTVSKETVAGYTPDIVVGRQMAFNDDSIGSISTLNDLGIQTYVQTASNMTDTPSMTTVIDDVRNLGEIFAVQEQAEIYADSLEERYQTIVEMAEKNKGSEELSLLPIVAFNGEDSSFSIFNISNSIQADMLKHLNVVPAIEGSSPDPSLETIISTNPDIILYVTADRNATLDATAVENIKNEPLLQNVNAIKEDRVYTVSYDDFMDYGPRIYDTFEMLGNELYN